MSSTATRQYQGDRCPPTWRAAAAALRGPSGRTRTGIGHDSHPFGPGAPLALGGVEIEGAPRLHGHSDGDVALHAISDALLGAAGLGDLGRMFPAGPATPAASTARELLDDVVGRARAAGWRPASLDLTIVAGRPQLGSRLDAMRDAIAGRSGSTRSAVNVKASTGQPRRHGGCRPVDLGARHRGARGAPDDDPAPRHARRRRRPLVPLDGGHVAHLLVRPDRLRAGAHRQLPLVPVRRPARPPPALAGHPGDAG